MQKSLNIQLFPLETFECYEVGNYKVTGYPANHGLPEQGCFIYKIEYEDSCIFYSTDTSILCEEVWHHMDITGTQFDLVVLDGTYGIGFESRKGDHLATKDFITHVKRFNDCGMMKEKGKIYASHISHEGIMEHSKFDEYAKEHGYRIAFDGLSILI